MFFQPKFQNWSWDWDVVMIKMKEKFTALFIRIRSDQNAKCVPVAWKLRILGLGLDPIHLLGNSKIPMLHEFPKWKFLTEYSCHSKTHRWESDSAWIVGSLRYSIQLERIHISHTMFLPLYSNSHVRTRCWRKSEQRWKTNSFLHTSQSDAQGRSRRRTTKRRLHETDKEHKRSKWKHYQDAVYWVTLATAQDKVLQFWHTRPNAIVVYTVLCHQIASTKLFLKWERVLFERLSTPRRPPKVVLKSSWQTQQQQQQDTSICPQLETVWEESGEGRAKRRSKQPDRGFGNIPRLETELRKSTSELKELLTM